jgi:hypothetical protein
LSSEKSLKAYFSFFLVFFFGKAQAARRFVNSRKMKQEMIHEHQALGTHNSIALLRLLIAWHHKYDEDSYDTGPRGQYHDPHSDKKGAASLEKRSVKDC